jgi:hypothetical protein
VEPGEQVAQPHRLGLVALGCLNYQGSGRPSILDPHIDYLHQRWSAGVTNATVLFAELCGRGYRDGLATLRTYLHPLRINGAPTPTAPKVRANATWLLRHPDTLHPDDAATLADVPAACPHLNALADHITAFA